MADISESGHSKNAANLKSLITYLQSLPNYQPINPLATLPSLSALLADSLTVLQATSVLESGYNTAVKNQQLAFATLPKLVTKIVNSFLSFVNHEEEAERVVSLGKKINGVGGKRPSGTKNQEKMPGDPEKETPETEATTGEETHGKHSTSQRSYDNQVANFAKMIDSLASHNFNPNEEYLKLATLAAFQTTLQSLTEAVDPAYIAMFNSKTSRNHIMYNLNNGMPIAIKKVKKYMRSAYDIGSPENSYVTALKFRFS